MFPTLLPRETTGKTLELREVIAGGVNIWDFDYPSYYKGEEKKAFEQKVIEHYYFREIGAETVGRFLHYFRRTMREIMPLYIQRYKSVELMDDPEIRPLDNYNMIEEFTQDTENTGSGSTTGSNNRSLEETSSDNGFSTDMQSNVHSVQDTPQGSLSIALDENGSVLVARASEISQDVNQGNNTSTMTRTGTSTETGGSSEESETQQTGKTTHTLTRRGNIGVTTYADLMEGYRKTFLNIDMEIIEELESCFMGVY